MCIPTPKDPLLLTGMRHSRDSGCSHSGTAGVTSPKTNINNRDMTSSSSMAHSNEQPAEDCTSSSGSGNGRTSSVTPSAVQRHLSPAATLSAIYKSALEVTTTAVDSVREICGWVSTLTGADQVARKLLVDTLRHGAIPKHVAFIMDGNRRFARRRGQKSMYGHSAGFAALQNMLSWCLDLGVEEVSVYAFSIENFRRSTEEVQGLMDLFKEKLVTLMEA